MTGPEAICTGGALLSLAYFCVVRWCFGKWACELPRAGASDAPITFLRPLKGGVPGLRAKLEANVQAMRADDQLILGVEPDSREAVLCEEVGAAFPERNIVVVSCVGGAALNPKISKLLQMMPHTRHERLTIADSEALLDPGFVTAWRAEWVASGAEVLTAGYSISGARSWPQRLDAAAVLVTLWPGLVILRAAGAIRLTLGACTAVRRADIASVGGWAAFGGELAEDNRLGAELAAAGRSIRLSRQVVALESDPLSWRDWWRHQLRVAVTYRAGSPLGFAGSIVTHGEAWSLLLIATGHPWGVTLFFAIWAARTATAAGMARRLGFEITGLPLAMLGASLAGSLCWVASWFSRSVWWGGKRWKVNFRGRLTGI